MTVEIRGLSRRFGTTAAIDDVDLTIGKGEFVALLGPSGSGKTTLLRIVAGLEVAEAGELTIDGRDARNLAPSGRGIGFVFQHYALFRHMRVADNIAFGLTVRPRGERPTRAAIAARVEELVRLVQLEGLERRFPAQLSGGQRQRVALARALAVEPSVLLLDEPFGALDAKVRAELRSWLRDLQRRLGVTTVFVTHDQEEALLLADRVAVMNAGRIEQIGAPAEIYDRPASPFVTEFLGAANRFDAVIRGGTVLTAERGLKLPVPRVALNGRADGPALLFVRPHEIRLGGPRSGPRAVVEDVAVSGARRAVRLTYAGLELKAELGREVADALALAPGLAVPFEFADAILFPTLRGGAAHRPAPPRAAAG